jgi:16S rRNA (uracil1498-N3)-methyltransferase
MCKFEPAGSWLAAIQKKLSQAEKNFPPVFFLDRTMEHLRFYHSLLQPGLAELSAAEGHHFVHVLRGKAGQTIELFDGLGRVADGVVNRIKKNEVFVQIGKVSEVVARQTRRIILAVAAAKGQRFDWMLSKCTEVGTDHIALVHFDRSVRLGKESAIERYQNLTISACKQCGRNILPVITGPQKLTETIHELKQQYPQSRFIYGSLESDARTVGDLADCGDDVIVFVGPEGGLTDAEIRLLKDQGAIPICAGSHILRTETAAIVFAAILEAMRIRKI